MFSFFLFLFFSYLIYRSFVPRQVPSRKRNRNSQRANDSNPKSASPSERQQMMVVDEMKKCPACGTFNPKSHALESGGNYYCEEKCKRGSV